MKKSVRRVASATAEVAVGSPAARYGGIDVGELYIDMLCEKFKNRGVKTAMLEEKSKSEKRGSKKEISKIFGIEKGSVSAEDKKYRTLIIDGNAYMSSDDFAAYYKDLRNYKMPNFYSRGQKEYEEAAKLAENVQESGNPPKKAPWLTVTSHVKRFFRKIPYYLTREGSKELSDEWFPVDEPQNRVEGKGERMPRGVIRTLLVLTLSFMLVVCSSVMVSRASAKVSSLEDKIERLEAERDDLYTDLEVKNNMLEIKRIAVEEYGMISGEYAASRYLDITEDEKIENFDKAKEESLFSKLLRAIGLKD